MMAGLQLALQRGASRSGIGLACQHSSRNPLACWATRGNGTARHLASCSSQVSRVAQAAVPAHMQPSDPHKVGAEEEQEQAKEQATRAYQYAMPWKEQLTEVLASIRDPGTFAYNAVVEVAKYEPVVMVEGVGRLAYPLCSQQAAALVAVGEPAPYGQGTQTVLNPAVRRATQVDASLVTISPSWLPVLQRIKEEALSKLGIGKYMHRHVEAHLYKLLLYEPGGHFKPHTDTEKEPGMFATLIVQLPAGHEGGSLEVKHAGGTVVWHSAVGSSHEVQYAAFYADCEHQLHPITSGHRLVLAYNLVRFFPGPALQPIDNSPALEGLCQAVSTWESQLESQVEVQSRVAVRLEHRYTRANVSFAALKGRDMAVVQLLQACDDLEVHLVVVTKTVQDPGYGEDTVHTKLWVSPCGSKKEMSAWAPSDGGYITLDVGKGGELLDGRALFASDRVEDGVLEDFGEEDGYDDQEDFDDDDEYDDYLYPDRRWKMEYCGLDGRPDERRVAKYTGNEGGNTELFYNRTLAVVWPRSRSLKLAKAAGFGPLLDLLALRIERPLNQGNGSKKQQVEVVMAMVREVVDAAATDPNGCFPGKGDHAVRLLQLLCSASRFVREAGDVESVAVVARAAVLAVSVLAWSEGVSQVKGDGALADLVTELNSPNVDAALVALVAHCAPKQVSQCVELACLPSVPDRLKGPVVDALLTAVLEEGSFAALSVWDVRTVARFVCRSAKGSLGGFASAVLAREDRQGVLKQLLQEPLVRAKFAHEAAEDATPKHVTGLFAACVQGLEHLMATPPTFSWEMPDASLPDNPQVEAFLRGPSEEQTFSTDPSQPDPLNIGNAYLLYYWAEALTELKNMTDRQYSVATKIESTTVVKITKTRGLFKRRVAQYEADRKELQDLKELMMETGPKPC